MLLLMLTASAKECDPALLDLALEAAERAYIANDERSVRESIDLAKSALCTTTSPAKHAQLHRANALLHLLKRESDDADEDLRAANAAFPLLGISEPLDTDVALTRRWMQAQEAPIDWTVSSRTTRLNGLDSRLIPDAPAFGTQQGPKMGLLGAGLAVLAVGAGTYGSAFATRSSYDKAILTPDGGKIRRLHTTTNALTLTGIGLSAAGSSLVVISLTR